MNKSENLNVVCKFTLEQTVKMKGTTDLLVKFMHLFYVYGNYIQNTRQNIFNKTKAPRLMQCRSININTCISNINAGIFRGYNMYFLLICSENFKVVACIKRVNYCIKIGNHFGPIMPSYLKIQFSDLYSLTWLRSNSGYEFS